MNKLKAVLFDLDGTIINTEPIHAKAILDAFKHFNIFLDEKKFENDFLGASDYDVWKAVLKDKPQKLEFMDLIKIKNKNFLVLLNESTAVMINRLLTSGVADFIQQLVHQNMKIGLVTASDLFQTTEVLKKIEFEGYFNVICTVNDTFFSKPKPSPYFYTMRQLRVKTDEVVIFEDSYFGLSAAMQTGAEVIGLATNSKEKANKKFQNIKFINDFKDVICQKYV